MRTPKSPIRALLLLLAASAAAQDSPIPVHKKPHPKPYQPPFNPNTIVLDPAHGGQDNGANLGRAGQEKDLTQAFAARLRDALAAKGFNVVLTHDDASADTTADQRVEVANRARAVACLILHATTSGHGIHLFTSALTLPSAASDTFLAPWDSAQAASLQRSLALANQLSTGLNGLRIPVLVARASVRPIDSMNCPAVTFEIAPEKGHSALDDVMYQQHLADSLADSLVFWRQKATDVIAAAQAASNPPATAGPEPEAPPVVKPKPKPKPIIVPDEEPLAPDAQKPAPIERKSPPPQAEAPR